MLLCMSLYLFWHPVKLLENVLLRYDLDFAASSFHTGSKNPCVLRPK